MKRFVIHIIMVVVGVVSTMAQNITYRHDASKMNQFTVAEIGSGGLTPALYYDLLHNRYRNTAAQRNKLAFRNGASVAAYQQVEPATDLDSAMIKRAEIEALNVADRVGGVADVAWAAEKNKINAKLTAFEKNINQIIICGGTVAHRALWLSRLNLHRNAILAIREAYMPNSERKNQYFKIYADIVADNETLLKFLVSLQFGKNTAELLAATYVKPDKNAAIASAAKERWRNAANGTKTGKVMPTDRWIINPLEPISGWAEKELLDVLPAN